MVERLKIKGSDPAYETEALVFKPKTEPKGIVCVLHGMCEYKERYIPFMEYLSEQGYIAVIYDHRGHGLIIHDPGELGYMQGGGADGLVEDAHCVIRELKRRYEGLPVVMLGHSMGSLIARSYCRVHDDELAGLILSGPPSYVPGAEIGLLLANILGKTRGWHFKSRLLQTLSLGSYVLAFRDEGDCAWICSEQNVVKEYEASPFCGFNFTTDGYRALFQLMKLTYQKKGWVCKNPRLPILFLAGENDPCAGGRKRFKNTIAYMRKAGYSVVNSRIYKDMRHEILNEKEHEQVFRDICKWMNKMV